VQPYLRLPLIVGQGRERVAVVDANCPDGQGFGRACPQGKNASHDQEHARASHEGLGHRSPSPNIGSTAVFTHSESVAKHYWLDSAGVFSMYDVAAPGRPMPCGLDYILVSWW
jgi:hypothetical protein